MKALILALGEYRGYIFMRLARALLLLATSLSRVNEKQGRKSVFLAAENEKRTAGTSRMQIILV